MLISREALRNETVMSMFQVRTDNNHTENYW